MNSPIAARLKFTDEEGQNWISTVFDPNLIKRAISLAFVHDGASQVIVTTPDNRQFQCDRVGRTGDYTKVCL